MFNKIIAEAIYDILSKESGTFTPDEIERNLEVPGDSTMGDIAFPCFKLAKVLRKPPQIIAQSIAERWHDKRSSASAVSGYLNIRLNRVYIAKEVISSVTNAGDAFAASSDGQGKTICIDYSSINIAKRFHVGHISTTMIGHSLKRVFDRLGYNTIGINHLGDWGTSFGKLIAAYFRYDGARDYIERDGINALTELYVRFNQDEKENPALTEDGRAWFLKIEQGDETALALFNWFKELTLKDARRVYDELGVDFDYYTGESFYNDKMQPIIDKLRDDGLLTQSQGAYVVNLDDEGMPPCLILKNDGATLYATRDLAAAVYRAQTYHFDQLLYVVAYQQDLHFRQLFAVLRKMGCEWADKLTHVSFGMVTFEGKKMGTRLGNVVFLDDMLTQAKEKARRVIDEKSPDLQSKDEAAAAVGIGAIVYAVLSAARIKDIDIRWEQILNFDGETGPYVQYAHARSCSLLAKADAAGLTVRRSLEIWNPAALDNAEAADVLLLIARMPDVVKDAARKYEPSLITRHVTDLSQAFNKYYFERRVLSGDPADQAAGVLLTEAARIAIKTGLYLIGVQAPTRM